MKRIYKIIPFILIFTLLFSTVSFGATSSGSTNKFANTFPLKADISYFNNSDCYPFYSFNTDLSSYISQALDAFEDDTNITLRRDELCYFLVYGEYRDMYLIFWYKYNEPTIEMINTDFYSPRFYGGKNQKTNDGFGIGRVKINKASYNNYFDFSTYYVSGNVDCLTAYDHCLKFAPTQETNFKYLNNSLGFWCYGVPLIVNSTSIPFEFTDTNGVVHNLTFFEGNVLDNEDTSDSEVVLPDIPENTDSNIITLIKSISSFFSQLFKKLTSLFSSLINKIEQFIQNVIDSISSVLDGIKEFFGKFISIFDSMYDFGVDSSGKFSIVRMIEKLFLPDDTYFLNKLNSFFHTHFEWLIQAKEVFDNIVDSLIACADSSESPQIVIPAGTYGYFVLDHDIVWNFDWYIPYKPTVDSIISAFIILFFVYRLLTSLPDIINGSGSPFSAAPLMGDLERGYKKGRSINITISNKKGG